MQPLPHSIARIQQLWRSGQEVAAVRSAQHLIGRLDGTVTETGGERGALDQARHLLAVPATRADGFGVLATYLKRLGAPSTHPTTPRHAMPNPPHPMTPLAAMAQHLSVQLNASPLTDLSQDWLNRLKDVLESIDRRRSYGRSIPSLSSRNYLIGIYFDAVNGAFSRYALGEWRARYHPLVPPGPGEALVYLRLGGHGHNQFYLEDRGPHHVAAFFRAYCERLDEHQVRCALERECLANRESVDQWVNGIVVLKEGMRAVIATTIARLSGEDPDEVEDRLEGAYLKDMGRGDPSGRQLHTLLQTHGISSKTLAEAAGFSYHLLYQWITGRRFPRPMPRLSVVWALAHLLRRAPEGVWDEIHSQESRPRPIPITLGPDVPFPLPRPVIARLHRIETTHIRRG